MVAALVTGAAAGLGIGYVLQPSRLIVTVPTLGQSAGIRRPAPLGRAASRK
jgi:hypothetical protein